MPIRSRIAGLAVALLVGAAPLAGVAQAAAPPPVAHAAKTCKRGVKTTMPDGSQKCLQAGEYCKRSWERTYERRGFTCRGGRLRSY